MIIIKFKQVTLIIDAPFDVANAATVSTKKPATNAKRVTCPMFYAAIYFPPKMQLLTAHPC